ncbi:hypothetical protein [Citrobacter koseri]|uniref:hypothetical protein n=1 Tax=Citrobacter koseri TaxID=545 RepID=UPI000E12DCA5|nr:hypothetical protein [Citrobacter koseri]EKW5657559.1 hypothetical protein [Citrobacter koseri]MBJ9281226.1 hypothetical protein [Citrobacter koseri]MDT7459971.1 hypothetical protein [Citrobacter koseri]SUX62724.1 Uncharacterised protein [Citrobacter koseri]HEI8290906.1 hypothetical protein [Citrobacter koseri]
MSILKTVQMFIAMNPGTTNREIAESLTQYNHQSVQRAVCRLFELELATRKRDGKNFRYYAEPPEGFHFNVCEPTPEVASLMEKATELESKGLYQRAATMYMEAFRVSGIESERTALLVERQRCLGLAKPAVTTEDGCFLAGRFAGRC